MSLWAAAALFLASFALGGFTRVWWFVVLVGLGVVVLSVLVAQTPCEAGPLGTGCDPWDDPWLEEFYVGLTVLAGLTAGTWVGRTFAERERLQEPSDA